MFTGSTTYYGIPYGKDGDTIIEADNKTQMQMVDWLLQAATGIADNGVIFEGTYAQSPDNGRGCLVLLNPSGGIALKAAFKGALARTQSSVVWEGLAEGNFYYLYIGWSSTLYTNPATFSVVSVTTPYGTDNKNYLFLATYDLTSGYPGVLNSNPDGKRYASGLIDHVVTRIDPHSPFLTQTNLTVTGSIQVGLEEDQSMLISQLSAISNKPLMTLSHANTTSPLIYVDGEFIIKDSRITTQLSDVDNATIDNGAISIVGAINKNTEDIATNTSNIATNTTNIATNAANIATNTSDIATNAANIATNTTDIATNTGSISILETDVANNTADIATNTSDIVTNTADIATNTGNIGLLQIDVAANTAAIALNTSHRNTLSGNPHNVIASETPFDNTGTILTSTNVQNALVELANLIATYHP